MELEGQAIYYMGPSPPLPGMIMGSCGPTTSARMDPFTPQLLGKGLKILIGKGPRSKAVHDALKKRRRSCAGVRRLRPSTPKRSSASRRWRSDLGPEALLRLEVRDFPATSPSIPTEDRYSDAIEGILLDYPLK